ncbi:MAG: 1-deoxy-D-xylulose-5-phosphate reductoisomerase [Gemmatimonadota bacterium]
MAAMTPRGVAILGATGSIGRSALAVIDRHQERFRVVALSAHTSAPDLDALAQTWEPELVVLSGEPDRSFDPGWRGEWRFGNEGLAAAIERPDVDIVLNALVGIAGLGPTLRALRAGKRLALANKESLVTGGKLVLDALAAGGGELVPVDSEHSAVHQCLGGGDARGVRRLILTASGGPFRDLSAADLAGVTAEQALDHPTWDMGAKITVDSATLANKALEVIEAHHLFSLPYERIEVVVHPTSIVHSMVEFRDGSILAQLGRPTMEIPILHALAWPDRVEDGGMGEGFDPVRDGPLSFEALRVDAFPMFRIGVEAGRAGGRAPVVYNAANEIGVEAFLAGRIGFPAIAETVEHVLGCVEPAPLRDETDVWETDAAARRLARTALEPTPGTRGRPAGDSREAADASTTREV